MRLCNLAIWRESILTVDLVVGLTSHCLRGTARALDTNERSVTHPLLPDLRGRSQGVWSRTFGDVDLRARSGVARALQCSLVGLDTSFEPEPSPTLERRIPPRRSDAAFDCPPAPREPAPRSGVLARLAEAWTSACNGTRKLMAHHL